MRSIVGLVILVLAIILAGWIGVQIGEGGADLLRGAALVIGAVAGLVILLRPHLGVVLLLSGLLLEEALPSVPFLTSAFQLIGAATVGAFFFHVVASRPMSQLKPQPQHILGAGFVVWLFLSHPETTVFLGERNWLLTYVQLWVLMWLIGQLINNLARQRVLIGTYIAAIVLSAVLSIQVGSIGETVGASYRASGMMAGANEAARRFVVGIVFSMYLVETAVSRKARLAAYGSLGLMFLGVVFTLSRTGFLLSLIAIPLVILLRNESKTLISRWSAILVMAGVSFFLVPDQYWQIMGSELFSTVVQSGGTVGVRYALWRAGLGMWVDHPVTGVGIGQFNTQLSRYGVGLLPLRKLGSGPHNIYVGLLAETGIVGLALFLALVISAVVALRQAMGNTNTQLAALARTWFIVLILILLGGLTKHDQYDKLLWLVLGMSIALSAPMPTIMMGRNRSRPLMRPGPLEISRYELSATRDQKRG